MNKPILTLLELKRILIELGYNEFDQTTKEIGVFVPANNVNSAFNKITTALSNLDIIPKPPNIITIKIFKQSVKDFDIRLRKKNLQRPKTTFGKKNEKNFIQIVNEFISGNSVKEEVKPITIEFVVNGAVKLRYENVSNVKDVSKKDPFAGNKADAHLLISGGSYIPISIKSNDASLWAEVARYWGQKAAKFLVYAVSTGKTDLEETQYKGSDTWEITPPIATRATKEESNFVIFGNDIQKYGGAVIKQTFKHSNFTWDSETETLTISTKYIIKDLGDVPEKLYPYMEIFTSGERNVKAINLKGIRAQASCKFRITSTYEVFGNEVRQWIN